MRTKTESNAVALAACQTPVALALERLVPALEDAFEKMAHVVELELTSTLAPHDVTGHVV